MEIFWSKETDNILNRGISLEVLGVRNWALSKEEALIALDELLKLKIPILGGDVCEYINDVLQYNYDNWYCEKLPNESDEDFLERSIQKSKDYINSYKENKVFFALVPDLG